MSSTPHADLVERLMAVRRSIGCPMPDDRVVYYERSLDEAIAALSALSEDASGCVPKLQRPHGDAMTTSRMYLGCPRCGEDGAESDPYLRVWTGVTIMTETPPTFAQIIDRMDQATSFCELYDQIHHLTRIHAEHEAEVARLTAERDALKP